MKIHWLLSASERLRIALHGREADANSWVAKINTELVQAFPNQVLLVRDYFQGYREFYGIVILLVEVQPLGDKSSGRFRSPGTYIVKVAFNELQADLKGEIDAWNHSRPQHVPFDNVFVALEAHPDEHHPSLLVYADANVVLGQRNIITLEDAFTQPCRFGVPIPESIDRVLASLYQRMNQSFFPHSHLEEPSKYLSADKPNLQELLDRYAESAAPSIDPEHEHDLHRRRHRRETLALLANEHEHYADPVDLLAGMKQAQIGPEVLRGTAHGDLHGRNVQVSMVKNEVSPAEIELSHRRNFVPANELVRMSQSDQTGARRTASARSGWRNASKTARLTAAKRDDANKKHLYLVPCADMPESQMEYDSKTVAETLEQ